MNTRLTSILFIYFTVLIFSNANAQEKEIKKIHVDSVTVSKHGEIPLAMFVYYTDGTVKKNKSFDFVDMKPKGYVKVTFGGLFHEGWVVKREYGVDDTDVTLFWTYKGEKTISTVLVRGKAIGFDVQDDFGNMRITREKEYMPTASVLYSDGSLHKYYLGQDTSEFQADLNKIMDKVIINKEYLKFGRGWSFGRKPGAKDGELTIDFIYKEHNTLKQTSSIPVLGQISNIIVNTIDSIGYKTPPTPIDYIAYYTDGSEYSGSMNSDNHPELLTILPPNALKLNKPTNSDWYLSVTPRSPTGLVMIDWRVVDGDTASYSTSIMVENEPYVSRMDIGSLPLGYCSHVAEELKISLSFNQSMKTDQLPVIEFEASKNKWTQGVIRNPIWSEAIVGLENSKLDCHLVLPHVPDQKIFMPIFKVSRAQGANHTGEMFTHAQEVIIPYLILKKQTSNWILLSKYSFNPGERISGRFNRNIKEGTFYLAVYPEGATNKNWLYFGYAPECSNISSNVPDKPGKYEYRLIQSVKNKDETVLKTLAVAGFVVKEK